MIFDFYGPVYIFKPDYGINESLQDLENIHRTCALTKQTCMDGNGLRP